MKEITSLIKEFELVDNMIDRTIGWYVILETIKDKRSSLTYIDKSMLVKAIYGNIWRPNDTIEIVEIREDIKSLLSI